MGDQGRAGRQAHPLREACHAQLPRSDGGHRGGASQRRVLHGSVHVSLPSPDREAGRVDPREGHRRGPAHQGIIQLPRRVQPRGEALQQRPGRRRHYGRRLLHDFHLPPDRRCCSGQGPGRTHRGQGDRQDRRVTRGRLRLRAPSLPRRHHRPDCHRRPARSGQCLSHIRFGRQHLRSGAVVESRQGGGPVEHVHQPPRPAR